MLLYDLFEAQVELERTKFWCNINTGKIIWLGGMDHHGHHLYYTPEMFGLSKEQVAHLADDSAMRSPDSEEPDEGGRIIYLPDLFWQVMQHGWVRGGFEGEYDYNSDETRLQPDGLYLEGKSLADLAKAARLISAEVEPDPEEDEDWQQDRWEIQRLRLAVRTGPHHDDGHSTFLAGDRARYFIERGRIPSKMMAEQSSNSG